mmetsp:Transcript_64320/g.140007  ORF Transcript_64320/g.140007 Transcript_64320/m.140007 type:complete len:214 (-) Transcript_64320:1470-2111(-)
MPCKCRRLGRASAAPGNSCKEELLGMRRCPVVPGAASCLLASPTSARILPVVVPRVPGTTSFHVLSQPRRHIRLGIPQNLLKIFQEVGVFDAVACIVNGDEGDRLSTVAYAAGSPNPMDIRVDVVGKVVVDNRVNLGDVQASRSHIRSHHDLYLPGPEASQVPLPLRLSQVAVQGAGVDVLLVKLLVEESRGVLCVAEDQDPLPVGTLREEFV